MRALDLGTTANGEGDPHQRRGVLATAAGPRLVLNVGAPRVDIGDRAVAVPVGMVGPGVDINLPPLDDPEAVAKLVTLQGPLSERSFDASGPGSSRVEAGSADRSS
jgi:hypothetical protein